MPKQPIHRTRSDTKPKQKTVKKVEEDYKLYQSYIKSKEFKELRSKVLERDNYTCQFCGRTLQEMEGTRLTLQAHHKRYDNVGKCNEEEMADIITLCSCCHRGCHQAPSNRRRFTDKHFIIDNIKEKP